MPIGLRPRSPVDSPLYLTQHPWPEGGAFKLDRQSFLIAIYRKAREVLLYLQHTIRASRSRKWIRGPSQHPSSIHHNSWFYMTFFLSVHDEEAVANRFELSHCITSRDIAFRITQIINESTALSPPAGVHLSLLVVFLSPLA